MAYTGPFPITAADGGTGVANAPTSTITLGGALTTTPANAVTLTTTGSTNVTLPTTGTLATTSQLPSLPLSGANGGTGVANTGLTINLGTGSTGKVLTSDSSGNATWQVLPSSSAVNFSAVLSTPVTNATGAGANYQLVADTVTYDTTSSYNNGTGVFTAPVTGKYLFIVQAYVNNTTVASNMTVEIVTTARTYAISEFRAASALSFVVVGEAIADMTAGDTAHFIINVGGEASDTDTVYGNNTYFNTWVQGMLFSDSLPIPIPIADGGTNATSFTQSNGIVTYNGTRLVNYAGPQISSGGIMTNTSQPAFFAFLSAGNTVNSATGDGTVFQLGTTNALTKKFDNGTNFNTNGTFTAPVTGVYAFGVNCAIGNIGASHTDFEIYVTAGGVNYNGQDINPYVAQSGVYASIAQGMTCLVHLNASDTAVANLLVAGGAKTIDVLASNSPNTYFYGYLVG